jgi:hypothetical protein
MKPAHAALVRDDRGNLQIRRFDTAADAARVAAGLEHHAKLCATPVALDLTKSPMLDHKTFARRLGIPSQLVRAAFRRGGLPGAVAHSHRLVHVPAILLDHAKIWGLLGLERRVKAGMIG